MANLPVNTQSGVDAALAMSQAGLNIRRSASIVLDDKAKKLEIQERMAQFEEWQSEDAKRYRSTVQKLQADSAQFMSENQELINSGWLAEQNARISENISQWTDNESDTLATILSPLMEVDSTDEAQRIYSETVYPQLQKFLPGRADSFSVPEAFDEEAFKKAQITQLASTRNRAQRQQLDLQAQVNNAKRELQKKDHEQQVRLATWDTYSKLLLMDQDYEYRLAIQMAKGEPLTLQSLGFTEDKLTHAINAAMPKAAEEVRSLYPDISDDNLATVAKALVSDAMQEAKGSWDTLALSGHNPLVALGGSFHDVFSRTMTERLKPGSPYFTMEDGLFTKEVRYNPSGYVGTAAQERERIRQQSEAREEGIKDIISQAKGTPEFDAMSPKAQIRWATKVWRDLETGNVSEMPARREGTEAPVERPESSSPDALLEGMLGSARTLR